MSRSSSRSSGSSPCKRILVPIIVIGIVAGVLFLILYFTVFRPNSLATSSVGKWDANRSLRSFNSCGTSKTIALTFDDGPDLAGTPNVLAALAKWNVKATFFMSPAVNGPPTPDQCKLFKAVLDAGHSPQSHSFDHTDFVGKTGQQVFDNLNTNQKWMNACLGSTYTGLSLFRPPYGSLNPDYGTFISKLGYTLASWNVESLDYAGGTSDQVFQNVQANFANVAPGDSVVLIMHDKHYINGGALGALDQIIPYFQNLGYAFITGPQCFARCQRDVCAAKNPVWPGTFDRVF